jgi:NDP-sugar pyrophosphorylase family protein
MNRTDSSLRAGILAAGRGERLRRGPSDLKPLVKISGKPLIERVLNSMAEAGADEVVVIINQDSQAVRAHVAQREWPFRLRWIVETTPTSMHSFLRLVEMLAVDGNPGPFLLSTVDTIASPQTYAHFIAEARRLQHVSVTLALSAPGDDEKPLLVRIAPGDTSVIAIGEGAAPSEYATAGIYAVRPIVLREAESAQREGIDALRKFLERLLERGYPIAGIPISRTVDVDHPGDIETAEALLRSAQR